MKIDAHHHFWQYNPKEYDWINDEMKAIRRDFLPADLKREIAATGIGGVVSVQVRQSLMETDWLLQFAQRNAFIRGVVGWAPLTEPGVRAILERFAHQPKFKGVRHVLQGEADDAYCLHKDFQEGIAALRPFGLVYDILTYERQLPNAIRFVDRNPQQVCVLDHIAKPRIKERVLSPWRENIGKMAE